MRSEFLRHQNHKPRYPDKVFADDNGQFYFFKLGRKVTNGSAWLHMILERGRKG